MDLGNKVLNDLISKDNIASTAAARNIIDSADTISFGKLCEKSEFLFDFIKEKINEKLINAVNSENFENIFKFIKIYNLDFEDFIIKAWVKFANEDLTDRILELFENGTNEEKAYAAGYFCHINDTLALDFLKENAFSDFEPLAQNSARALFKFDERDIFNKAISVIQSNADDFEKFKYVNFLLSFGDTSCFDFLYDYLKISYTKGFVASSILYLKSFSEIIKDSEEFKAYKIFDIILSSYPEEISLDTVFDFKIFDFIKYLAQKLKDRAFKDISYIKRLILKAKYKFNLISREEIYTFDLNKDVKKEINLISGFLNTLDIDLFKGIEEELKSDDKERVLETLDVILNYGKKEFSNNIKDAIQNTKYEDVIAEGVNILKTFNSLNLLNKDEILSKINNKNIKAIVLNAFN